MCLLWDVSLLINFYIPAFLLSRVPVNVELFVRCSPITFLLLVRFLCLFEKRVERSLKRAVCNNDLVCNRHMSLSVPTFCLESKRMNPTQTTTR